MSAEIFNAQAANPVHPIDDHALLTLLELAEAGMGPEQNESVDESIERSDLAQAKAEALQRLGRQEEAAGALVRAHRTRSQALGQQQKGQDDGPHGDLEGQEDLEARVSMENELARRLLDMGATEEALSAWGRAFEMLITVKTPPRRLLDGMVTYGRHLMKRTDKKSERRLQALGELFSRASKAA
jgi:tetratricopeptide (TPR) repeat protein